MSKPFILGLTGSIGMGKSTVAVMFADFGVPVFDADAAVYQMQGPDGSLLLAIEANFPGTTGLEGVDRPALASKVFSDPEALARLEAIIHPAVAQMREAFRIQHIDQPLIVFDIPLLFEKDRAKKVDAVVVVSADGEVQRARVLARPGMTPARFEEILGLQTPDAQKRVLADYVIDTGCSLEETRSEVESLIKNISR